MQAFRRLLSPKCPWAFIAATFVVLSDPSLELRVRTCSAHCSLFCMFFGKNVLSRASELFGSANHCQFALAFYRGFSLRPSKRLEIAIICPSSNLSFLRKNLPLLSFWYQQMTDARASRANSALQSQLRTKQNSTAVK